jgi:putative flippase GtrA
MTDIADHDLMTLPPVAPAREGWLQRVYRHSFTRFAAFGLAGLAFDMTVLALLVGFTPLPAIVCVAIAFAATYALNFALNRRYSFGATGHVGPQLARFAPQVSADFVLTIVGVELLTTGLGLGVLVARVLAGGTNAVLNYTAYRWWTFRKAPETPAA